MTNSAKNKGDRAERELAKILADELGVVVRRKLGAGRADDTGDLDGLDGVTVQAKDWKDVVAAIHAIRHDLPVQMANAGNALGTGFVRHRSGIWTAVQPIEQWCTWYREATS